MTFGFERALEIMRKGRYVLLDMDVYFILEGKLYRDSPASDENDNLIYGVGIEELKGLSTYEILSDEWWESTNKL